MVELVGHVEGARKVVYKALFGVGKDFETFQELTPSAIHPAVDYICFTDREDLRSETWEVFVCEPPIASDPARSSKYVKIVGHEKLAAYDQWLWADNRLLLRVSPLRIFAELQPQHDLAFMKHPSRSTLEQEFAAVLEFKKDNPEKVRSTYQFLIEHAPELLYQPVLAGGLFVRRNTPRVQKLMRDWWVMVRDYSKRDQLSLTYALSKTQTSLKILPFLSTSEATLQLLSSVDAGRHISRG